MVLVFFLVPTLLFTALLLVLLVWRRRVYTAFQGTNIPGPPPSNLLWGNLYDYWTPTNVDRFATWCKQYGHTFGFYLGDCPFVWTKDVELLKQVLVKDSPNFVSRGHLVVRDSYHPRVKHAIVFAQGEAWKKSRSRVSHAFSVTNVKKMMPAIHEAVAEFLQRLEDTSVVDVCEVFSDLTFDVLGKGAFGIDVDAQKTRAHPILSTTLRTNPAFMSGLGYDLFQCLSSVSFLLEPLGALHGKTFGNPLLVLVDVIKPVIAMRLLNPSPQRRDILQHLLDAEVSAKDTEFNQKATNEDAVTSEWVCLNSATVFVAGYDTTRLTLAYWAFYMAKYPGIQSKMRTEVQNVVAKGV